MNVFLVLKVYHIDQQFEIVDVYADQVEADTRALLEETAALRYGHDCSFSVQKKLVK